MGISTKRSIKFSPPDITEEEIEAVSNVLRSGWITTGPETKQFEKEIAEYCGTNKAVCLSSATIALELALRILGIGQGDEVIVPAYTYTASVSVIDHIGAKIVMVDCAKDSYEMDYALVEKAITGKTKAIIPVDIAGVMCDYDKIFKIVNAKKKLFKPNPNNLLQKAIGRIVVVADGAHSFGAVRNGKTSGSVADFTSFSFHAVKNLTTSEGGAITWRTLDGISDEEIYRDFMLYSLHGQSKDALAKTTLGGWEYDIVYPGFKGNMTDIMAAIGRVQLKRYPKLLERRREIIDRYYVALKNADCALIEHYSEDYNSSMHLFLVRISSCDEQKRNEIFKNLAENGVACSVHYKPLPMMTAYKKLGFNIKDYPNAFAQYQNEITLPLNTMLSNDDVDYIIENFLSIIK